MIKAIFFDVDGTLLSHKTKQVPKSAREGLSRLRQQGIKIYLSTGRHMMELNRMPVSEIKFDGYVTLNGQLCLNSDQKVLYDAPFDIEVTEKLAEMFRKKEMPLVFVEKKRIYINFVNDLVRKAQKEISTKVPSVQEYGNEPVYQATTYLRQEEEKKFEYILPKGCSFARWSRNGVDIISETGGKVAGIRHIQKFLGISREEIMAFGDAGNDIEMLKYAGIGVAMGNAGENVKKAADFVTDDIDKDGVWKALRHFLIF